MDRNRRCENNNKSLLQGTILALLIGARSVSAVMLCRQSEHIGHWATPHHLSDVRRGAPSCIWDYLAHSDITIYV